MNEQHKNRFSLRSAAGILILLGVVVFGNIAVGRLPMKLDITENKLYTLSEGTKNILRSVKDPVTFKLYFSKSLEGVPPGMKNYAKRVENLLEEFTGYNSQFSLEKIDPEPDSEEEELAQTQGIHPQAVAQEVNFYFGLVVSGLSSDEVIPLFDESREGFLEYDIARCVYLLSKKGKVKLGLVSPLKLLGEPQPPMQYGPPPEGLPKPWLFTSELKQLYDVVEIEDGSASIAADVDLLLIVQPKTLSDKMLYAIDQFVLSGKNVIVFVDPFHMADERNSRFSPPSSENAMDRLFKVWGVRFQMDKVVLDPILAAPVRMGNQGGVVKHPAWLSIRLPSSFSRDDIITAQLSDLLMLYPGSVEKRDGVEGVTITPLVTSSAEAKSQDKFQVMYAQPKDLAKDLRSGGVVQTLAASFKGKFKSAFDAAPEGSAAGAHLKESKESSAVVVVADVDMLEDNYCLQELNMFGQVLGYRPINQNTSFLQNVVEVMTGNKDLISLRSRGLYRRPFDKVMDIENRAREKWQKEEERLVSEVEDFKKEISDLMKAVDPGQGAVIPKAVQDKVRQVRERQYETSKQLRRVRREQRGDIESLGSVLKAVNILAMPVIIGMVGIVIALRRVRRLRHER